MEWITLIAASQLFALGFLLLMHDFLYWLNYFHRTGRLSDCTHGRNPVVVWFSGKDVRLAKVAAEWLADKTIVCVTWTQNVFTYDREGDDTRPHTIRTVEMQESNLIQEVVVDRNQVRITGLMRPMEDSDRLVTVVHRVSSVALQAAYTPSVKSDATSVNAALEVTVNKAHVDPTVATDGEAWSRRDVPRDVAMSFFASRVWREGHLNGVRTH